MRTIVVFCDFCTDPADAAVQGLGFCDWHLTVFYLGLRMIGVRRA